MIPFRTGLLRTHYALVHADGGLLDADSATFVVQSDRSYEGRLASLDYLPPPESAREVSTADEHEAYGAYLRYLDETCGYLTLEGMPADAATGSRRLTLESLYIPLHVTPLAGTSSPYESTTSTVSNTTTPDRQAHLDSEDENSRNQRIAIASVIRETRHWAVLSPPGGGKSTLIKRLATAYAFRTRRDELGDSLPHLDCLPIVLRCRHLGQLASGTILDAINAIAVRAEMPATSIAAFSEMVQRRLRDGSILLLVDGLDEIQSTSSRMAFAVQLRTFLAVYPMIRTVVTSRETGFRVVAGALAETCQCYRMADFSSDDVRALTLAWHEEVVGRNAEVRRAAEDLSDDILQNDRLRRLAVNPLLLMTLLLVNRWIGQLPRRRTMLYGKAIDVLLMTWNVEGHESIDVEEAIPQLAYLALMMMRSGEQRISNRELRSTLTAARHAMPDILGFTKFSVGEFTSRIEDRSSILALAGHDLANGALEPFYEFKHLTFQEYLAALALSQRYVPTDEQGADLGELAAGYIGDSTWREVIGLSAVLAGRGARTLIERVLQVFESDEPVDDDLWTSAVSLLCGFLIDEVPMLPSVLDNVIEDVVLGWNGSMTEEWDDIVSGRYGDYCRSRLPQLWGSHSEGNPEAFAELLFEIGRFELLNYSWTEFTFSESRSNEQLMTGAARVLEGLASGAEFDRALAAGGAAALGYSCSMYRVPARVRRQMERVAERLAPLLVAPNVATRLLATWGLAWLGTARGVPASSGANFFPRLVRLWLDTEGWERSVAAWAAAALPLIDQEMPLVCCP